MLGLHRAVLTAVHAAVRAAPREGGRRLQGAWGPAACVGRLHLVERTATRATPRRGGRTAGNRVAREYSFRLVLGCVGCGPLDLPHLVGMMVGGACQRIVTGAARPGTCTVLYNILLQSNYNRDLQRVSRCQVRVCLFGVGPRDVLESSQYTATPTVETGPREDEDRAAPDRARRRSRRGARHARPRTSESARGSLSR